MTIYGLSQSTGVERRLKVEKGGQGIVLTVLEHVSGEELGRVMLSGEDLLGSITDPAPGGSKVEGVVPPHGEKVELSVEIRRNEVFLHIRGLPKGSPDVAVGLDDFQDALEGALSRT